MISGNDLPPQSFDSGNQRPSDPDGEFHHMLGIIDSLSMYQSQDSHAPFVVPL